jgi:hypothetical protein
MEPTYNSTKALMNYLSTDENPVTVKEMLEFWISLEPWERVYFETRELV